MRECEARFDNIAVRWYSCEWHDGHTSMPADQSISMSEIFGLPIRRERLYEQVADRIQDLIVAESLKPGDKLPSERELAERLGLSRTVIREAIHALSVRGLVHVKPGCGAYVRELKPQDAVAPMGLLLKLRQKPRTLENIYEVRRAIEVEAAGLAAERATEEDIAVLEQTISELEAHADDPRRLAECDMAFHAAVAAATQNELFCVLVESVGQLWLEMILLSYQAPQAPRDGVRFHREILRCIRERNPEEARRIMLEHVCHSQRLVEMVERRAGITDTVGKSND